MVALAISTAAAIPTIWRKERGSDLGVTAFAAVVVAWFAWRAWHSPVAELGNADLMLLAGAVGGFVCVRGFADSAVAERVFIWGVALFLLANLFVIGKQIADPTFAPVFHARAAALPSGFYSHYNEAANYLIASSLLLAAAALLGNHRRTTRIVWSVIAAAGLAAIYFVRSRGGILGGGIGCGVLAAAMLIVGHRSKARWFGPAVIAVPIIFLGLIAFVISGWSSAQEVREQGASISSMFDNTSRLYLLGIAVSCVAMHPLTGGGSRSFSWESFQFFDAKMQGESTMTLPDQVHNELFQSVTDYGLIGGGLLVGLLGTLLLRAVVRLVFAEVSAGQGEDANAWWAGGLAAFAGMFVQSSFSFVFHLFPGVLLLGISLGFLSRPISAKRGKARVIGTQCVLTAAALASFACLAVIGWTGTRVSRILWPTYFGQFVSSGETRADALTAALAILPTAEFYQARAVVFQEMAVADPQDATKFAERAINDYAAAELLHPHNPEPAINRANLLESLHRDAEAEAAFARAIRLQGGMEAAFHSHFLFSQALLRKGVRQYSATDPVPTLTTVELAAQQMELAVKEMPWIIANMKVPRVFTHESLGAAREANGDFAGAMEEYDFASKLDFGATANYRAGLLNGKIAAAAWAERKPGEALGRFIEAERRLTAAREFLPAGVTQAQRYEYLEYLKRTIAFLKGAKVEPIPVN